MKLIIFLSTFCLLGPFTTALDCAVYSDISRETKFLETHEKCFKSCKTSPTCITYFYDGTCHISHGVDKIDTTSELPTQGYIMCPSDAPQCYVYAGYVSASGMATVSEMQCFESCRENPQCIQYDYSPDKCILLVGKTAVPDVLAEGRLQNYLWKRFTCDLRMVVPHSAAEPVPSNTTPELEPTVTSTEPRHLGLTPEKEPSCALPEKEPTTTLPEKEPTTTLPEKEPTTTLPEKEPSTALPEKEPFLTPPTIYQIYKQQPSGEYIEVDHTVYRQQHQGESLKSTTDKQPKRKIPLLNLLMSGKGLCLRSGDQEKTVEGEIGSSMTGEQPSITINVLMMPPYQQDSSRP